jgi:hypothetical protein
MLLTAFCVVAGVLARFWELGKWPLAIDEYYFARSVENVLHSGIPRFACGGLYVRGLLLQYASAALEWLGLTAELAPRLIAAVTSLLTLPAVFLLGRRVGGRDLGLLAVAILAVSVWEIEIARFGRMYAPFQAVFAWYLVFFVAYSVDRRRQALAPMLILSAIGVLMWEGGIFLVLANLLPPFIAHPTGRLQRRDWLYLVAASLLFIPAYPLTLADLRWLGSEPPLPLDYQPPPDVASQSRLDAAVMPWTTLASHPMWALVAIVPTALLLFAIVRTVRTQSHPLPALGLIAVLGCAALQQFELAAGIVVVLLLLSILGWRDLTGKAARPLHAAVLSWLLFWVAFGMASHDWHAEGLSPLHTVLLLGYEFARLPDLVREVAMPWGRTVPILGLGLFILIAAACIRACIRADDTSPTERVLLALFVILLLAASSAHPPRHETRYVFFLYPLAVIYAIAEIQRAMRGLFGATRIAATGAALACLAAFALSEDFRPLHLWNIDSEAVNFRIGMGSRLAGHYHPRSDVRAAASWLQARAVPRQDIVIVSFPGVDYYYRDSDFYFVADSDPRFEAWSCSRGTIQRWSNLPMIHSFTTLAARVASGRRVWMVLESSRMADVLAQFPPADWTLEWTSRARDIVIVKLQAPQGSP